MSFVLYFILVPLIFMVVRVILIILHEMSDAVAALLLTNGDVKVWLGFHKEPEACPRMTFGWLEILFLPNPLQWRGGYCLTTDVDELSLTRHVIIIAAGALGSLVDSGRFTAQTRGSMHGEVGQTQFMPKTVLQYGVGNLDTAAGALDSTANYLKAHGWSAGQGYQPGEPNFGAIQAWNAASVYQQAIAHIGQRIDAQ